MSALQVLVIGGGAAGFFAAINCAELARAQGRSDVKVTLLEATRRPLTKVRVSGGGRCNVTHHCFDPTELVKNYPRGSRELRGPFTRFQAKDTVAWFEARGVRLKTEADGRMFPTTDDSDTIARCLLDSAAAAGVDLRLGAVVRALECVGTPDVPKYRAHLRGDELIEADRILIATGSMPAGYELARRLGHEITPLVPSLFTFEVKDPRLDGLPGISFPSAHLTLGVDGAKERFRFRGPLLITHWGLSGPAVLKLSAFAAVELHRSAYQADLEIALLADAKPDDVMAALLAYKAEHPRRTLHAHLPLELPKRYWQRLVETKLADPHRVWAEASKKELQSLTDELTRAKFRVQGKGEFKEEFVTAGGIRAADVDFRTLQSRIRPGLFFAGEILDVDGITGGFNFQNAWTTGFIAAQSMLDLGIRLPPNSHC